jgi:hypothetical protein
MMSPRQAISPLVACLHRRVHVPKCKITDMNRMELQA